MADEIGQSLRFSRRTLPRLRFLWLPTLVVLIWIFAPQSATASPVKTVSVPPEQKITAEVQGSTPLQLGSEFCSQTVNIMPLGNSITRGYGTGPNPTANNFNYGFRYYLDNSLSTSNYYDFDFVGSLNDGAQSGKTFDYDHEGHGGFRADQLVPEMAGYLSSAQPDVILLFIGTNDVAQRNDNNYVADVADVEDILNAIDTYSTEAIVILAQIIDQDPSDSRYQDGAVSTYNGLLATMAQTRINSGDKLMLVDMYNALDYSPVTGDMEIAALPDDWLHPNDNGYQKIAGVWFNAMESIQPDCSTPVITSTAPATGFVDEVYTYDVNATGVPTPTYALTTAPNGMTIDSGTGVISWTPAANQNGPHSVEVEATNVNGTDTQTFMVTVFKRVFLPFIQN